MGFRNPITSAADVDTRVTPAGAGGQLYNDNSDPAHPRAILELSDGFLGDVPARLTQTAVANTHAENASASGVVTLSGGSYGGTAAPDLALGVEVQGDGSLRPTARLAGLLLRPTTSGFVTYTTDSSGNGFLPHGLGQVPTGVLITPGPQLSGLLSNIVAVTWTSADATNFSFYVHRTDTSAALASQAVRFSWHAFV